MADGCAELIFHYKGRFDEVFRNEKTEKSFLSGIHGQCRQFRRFKIHESFGIFGVYLYPFAIPELFNFPANEASDQMPDLRSLFGTEGKDLEEKMMLAGNNGERIQIISGFLKYRLAKSKNGFNLLNAAIQMIIHRKGQINVNELAGQCFLSTRQFERKFRELSGFNPKLYSRIIRFQAVFNEFNNEKPNLSEIAYKCGYYDQSHFIQDFKEFSGYNPKQFLSGKTKDTTIWDE